MREVAPPRRNEDSILHESGNTTSPAKKKNGMPKDHDETLWVSRCKEKGKRKNSLDDGKEADKERKVHSPPAARSL